MKELLPIISYYTRWTLYSFPILNSCSTLRINVHENYKWMYIYEHIISLIWKIVEDIVNVSQKNICNEKTIDIEWYH